MLYKLHDHGALGVISIIPWLPTALLKHEQKLCSLDRCEHVTVKFQQRDLETANDWDTLTPGNTAEYAWDEPMAAHRLRVVLESATEAFRDAPVQEYNLDDIKVASSPLHWLLCHTQGNPSSQLQLAYLLAWHEVMSHLVYCTIRKLALLGKLSQLKTSELLLRLRVCQCKTGSSVMCCHCSPGSSSQPVSCACAGPPQGAVGTSPLQDSAKGGQCGAGDQGHQWHGQPHSVHAACGPARAGRTVCVCGGTR